MHDDSVAGRKGTLEPRDGHVQSRQLTGIVKMIQRWSKEAAGLIGIGQPPLDQQARDDRLEAKRARQPFGGRLVGCGWLPDWRDHSPTAAASVNASPSRPIWRNF